MAAKVTLKLPSEESVLSLSQQACSPSIWIKGAKGTPSLQETRLDGEGAWVSWRVLALSTPTQKIKRQTLLQKLHLPFQSAQKLLANNKQPFLTLEKLPGATP